MEKSDSYRKYRKVEELGVAAVGRYCLVSMGGFLVEIEWMPNMLKFRKHTRVES